MPDKRSLDGDGVPGAPMGQAAALEQPRLDRSMRVMEYLVACVAIVAAVALAFAR